MDADFWLRHANCGSYLIYYLAVRIAQIAGIYLPKGQAIEDRYDSRHDTFLDRPVAGRVGMARDPSRISM